MVFAKFAERRDHCAIPPNRTFSRYRLIWPPFADANSEFADANSELPDANSEFADANSEFADANSELADANPEFADANSEFADAKSEFADANSDFADANSEFADASPCKSGIGGHRGGGPQDRSKSVSRWPFRGGSARQN